MFGYGSLVARRDGEPDAGPGRRDGDRDAGPGRLAHLSGYRRAWSVAMDNGVEIPGYKCYVDPVTGRRPDVFVAFLNITPSPGSLVNGTLSEVSTGELADLDRRERNYARIDVTEDVTDGGGGAIGGTVWCYVGTPEARERFARGSGGGRVVIQADYHARVRRAFADAAPGGLREFDRLTAPPTCPIIGLRRVDL